MIDYRAAQAVALIVHTGSFEAAASALHVTPSAVSQRVKALEERLGTILIERGSPCRATEKGAWLCRHMEQLAMMERELMDHLPGVGDETGPVTVTVACNADSLATWLMPALSEFATRTEMLVDLAIDDEDHTDDWLRRGKVMAAVTGNSRAVQGCQVTPIGALHYYPTATPEFVDKYFPDGPTAAAFAAAPAITFNRKDLHQAAWVRQTVGRDVIHPTHWIPSTQGFVDACLGGMGWAMNVEIMVRDHLASGRLVALSDTPYKQPLFWQVSRIAATRLDALTKAVNKAAGVLREE